MYKYILFNINISLLGFIMVIIIIIIIIIIIFLLSIIIYSLSSKMIVYINKFK